MNSVGTILRTERERQGRDTAEIAAELCITQRYVRAIEQDDLQNLPGSFFYKSFVKQYAAVLGVDEAPLQPGISALTGLLDPLPLPGAGPRSATKPAEDPPHRHVVRHLDPIVEDGNQRYLPDRRMGLPLVALTGMVLATSLLYSWYNKAQQSPAPVARVETPAPVPAGSSLTLVKDSAPADQPASPAIDVTTTTGDDGVNHVVLNLSATEKTWLSITSEGKQIFSGVLEPSQTKTLTGLEMAKLKVGNAGGLEVRWNGKPIGPIGPRGQVRVVLFTPENFQILMPSQTM